MSNYTDKQVEEANQKLLNKAVAHLRKTGVKSCLVDDYCIYAGSGCAFSPAVLPKYLTTADGSGDFGSVYTAKDLIERGEFIYDWAKACDTSFVESLQSCHDTSPNGETFLASFESNASLLAKQWDLTYPRVEEK